VDCCRVSFAFTLPTPRYTKWSPALKFVQQECVTVLHFHHDFYMLHPSQSLQSDVCINENRNVTMFLSYDSRMANDKHKQVNKQQTLQQ
jgi:hypothetical protein